MEGCLKCNHFPFEVTADMRGESLSIMLPMIKYKTVCAKDQEYKEAFLRN